MKRILVLLAFLLPVITYAQDHQKLLTRSYSEAQLSGMLINNQDWVTLPAYSKREFWDGLPASIRSELIKRGEDLLKFSWGVVKATDYMEFTRTGDRNIMQNPNSDRKNALQALALAELAEGKGRFTDQLINGIWAVCEQSSWVLSAHLPVTRGKDLVPDVTNPVIDLGSADAGALLA